MAVYATKSNKPFVTSKNIFKKKAISKETREMWKYFDTHNISVSSDGKVTVTKKGEASNQV